MKFVTVRDLRGKTSELWKELEAERELVVTSNGKPIAILSATDEASFEDCLWTLRRSRASFIRWLRQRESQPKSIDMIAIGDPRFGTTSSATDREFRPCRARSARSVRSKPASTLNARTR